MFVLGHSSDHDTRTGAALRELGRDVGIRAVGVRLRSHGHAGFSQCRADQAADARPAARTPLIEHQPRQRECPRTISASAGASGQTVLAPRRDRWRAGSRDLRQHGDAEIGGVTGCPDRAPRPIRPETSADGRVTAPPRRSIASPDRPRPRRHPGRRRAAKARLDLPEPEPARGSVRRLRRARCRRRARVGIRREAAAGLPAGAPTKRAPRTVGSPSSSGAPGRFSARIVPR